MKVFDYQQVLDLVAAEMAAEREERREHLQLVSHGRKNPRGHIFLTVCGATACVFCGRIAWR